MKGAPGGFGADLSKPPSIHSYQQSITTSSTGKATKQDGYINGAQDDDDDDEEDEFYDADDGTSAKLDGLSLNDDRPLSSKDLPAPKIPTAGHGMLDHDPDSDVFANPIDVFIHS